MKKFIFGLLVLTFVLSGVGYNIQAGEAHPDPTSPTKIATGGEAHPDPVSPTNLATGGKAHPDPQSLNQNV